MSKKRLSKESRSESISQYHSNIEDCCKDWIWVEGIYSHRTTRGVKELEHNNSQNQTAIFFCDDFVPYLLMYDILSLFPVFKLQYCRFIALKLLADFGILGGSCLEALSS